MAPRLPLALVDLCFEWLEPADLISGSVRVNRTWRRAALGRMDGADGMWPRQVEGLRRRVVEVLGRDGAHPLDHAGDGDSNSIFTAVLLSRVLALVEGGEVPRYQTELEERMRGDGAAQAFPLAVLVQSLSFFRAQRRTEENTQLLASVTDKIVMHYLVGVICRKLELVDEAVCRSAHELAPYCLCRSSGSYEPGISHPLLRIILTAHGMLQNMVFRCSLPREEVYCERVGAWCLAQVARINDLCLALAEEQPAEYGGRLLPPADVGMACRRSLHMVTLLRYIPRGNSEPASAAEKLAAAKALRRPLLAEAAMLNFVAVTQTLLNPAKEMCKRKKEKRRDEPSDAGGDVDSAQDVVEEADSLLADVSQKVDNLMWAHVLTLAVPPSQANAGQPCPPFVDCAAAVRRADEGHGINARSMAAICALLENHPEVPVISSGHRDAGMLFGMCYDAAVLSSVTIMMIIQAGAKDKDAPPGGLIDVPLNVPGCMLNAMRRMSHTRAAAELGKTLLQLVCPKDARVTKLLDNARGGNLCRFLPADKADLPDVGVGRRFCVSIAPPGGRSEDAAWDVCKALLEAMRRDADLDPYTERPMNTACRSDFRRRAHRSGMPSYLFDEPQLTVLAARGDAEYEAERAASFYRERADSQCVDSRDGDAFNPLSEDHVLPWHFEQVLDLLRTVATLPKAALQIYAEAVEAPTARIAAAASAASTTPPTDEALRSIAADLRVAVAGLASFRSTAVDGAMAEGVAAAARTLLQSLAVLVPWGQRDEEEECGANVLLDTPRNNLPYFALVAVLVVQHSWLNMTRRRLGFTLTCPQCGVAASATFEDGSDGFNLERTLPYWPLARFMQTAYGRLCMKCKAYINSPRTLTFSREYVTCEDAMRVVHAVLCPRAAAATAPMTKALALDVFDRLAKLGGYDGSNVAGLAAEVLASVGAEGAGPAAATALTLLTRTTLQATPSPRTLVDAVRVARRCAAQDDMQPLYVLDVYCALLDKILLGCDTRKEDQVDHDADEDDDNGPHVVVDGGQREWAGHVTEAWVPHLAAELTAAGLLKVDPSACLSGKEEKGAMTQRVLACLEVEVVEAALKLACKSLKTYWVDDWTQAGYKYVEKASQLFCTVVQFTTKVAVWDTEEAVREAFLNGESPRLFAVHGWERVDALFCKHALGEATRMLCEREARTLEPRIVNHVLSRWLEKIFGDLVYASGGATAALSEPALRDAILNLIEAAVQRCGGNDGAFRGLDGIPDLNYFPAHVWLLLQGGCGGDYNRLTLEHLTAARDALKQWLEWIKQKYAEAFRFVGTPGNRITELPPKRWPTREELRDGRACEMLLMLYPSEDTLRDTHSNNAHFVDPEDDDVFAAKFAGHEVVDELRVLFEKLRRRGERYAAIYKRLIRIYRNGNDASASDSSSASSVSDTEESTSA
eukprot:TRINITY_DN27808_c0_g1_i1.p1 TRINITY_DN27808_c0_g1~~TRINITY_DN27808_c0_g1_i1.p1  ORF type:complete len:1423 (+),score=308.66 TRINITY_DN27808_c0_g1_i1:68-4336(+)